MHLQFLCYILHFVTCLSMSMTLFKNIVILNTKVSTGKQLDLSYSSSAICLPLALLSFILTWKKCISLIVPKLPLVLEQGHLG